MQIANRMKEFSPFYVMEILQRAKQLEKQGREIIHMEVGEPDFSTPTQVIEAGIRNIQTGEVKYTAASGLPELREKIATHYFNQYAVNIPVERIFITPGATGAFLLALGATLNPGEEIIMADPCYPCNSNFVEFFSARAKLVNVNASTEYQLTANLIKQHWGEKTCGALIASPSNPTGTLISKQQLKQSIDWVKQMKGCFYSDEIYHGLVYDNKAYSALQFSEDVFVINSFSKYYAMTGWRVGWLVVPDAYIDTAEKIAQNIFISTPTHSQYAALSAFNDENLTVLEERKQVFKQRRDFLYNQLLRLGFEIPIKPAGAFYIYARCSRFTDDSYQFAKDLLEQEGIAVTPGKDFGNNEENCYIRFAYTASIAKMTIAMEKLAHFLAKNK